MVRRLALVLPAVVLAVAACGDGSGDDPTGPTPGDTPRTVSGGEPIGPAAEGIEGVEAFRVRSNAHTEEDLAYDHTPPAGGDHYPVPGTCGFYESDPPPDELLVHDLEHGAVWIAYDQDLTAADKAVLSGLVAREAKVTATPVPDLGSPLVVTAWARQLRLDRADDPRLAAFVATYRNSGNAPEPGGACQGAGTPAVASPSA